MITHVFRWMRGASYLQAVMYEPVRHWEGCRLGLQVPQNSVARDVGRLGSSPCMSVFSSVTTEMVAEASPWGSAKN